jgi:nucleotide-binding universal stress UspA family protein
MFRTIVAGTDGADKGRNAVTLAHELAWAIGARVLIVAVYDHGPTQPADLVRRLRVLRNELAPEALVLTVPDASPANGLRRVAEQQAADLIVVGARQRSRMRRFLEGDPGMRVLRGARCAVAVVPDQAVSPQPLQRIGLCVGEGPESEAALDLAHELAIWTGADVTTLASLDGAAARHDLLVVDTRDAGAVREPVASSGCSVMAAPRRAYGQRTPAAQATAART